MGTQVHISVGSQVWVKDPDESWIDGEVLDVNGSELRVQCTSGKKVIATAEDVYPKDTEASPSGLEDMTKLPYLNEPAVLQNLRSRFAMNEIYTYTGDILIAVNPFQKLPHLTSIHMMEQYKGAEFGELSPNPFAIADISYRQMMKDQISQSILVSGESGAGKTETTKMLMRYLAYMGGRAEAEGRSVEQQVLESNPVLEAFGNAKTVRNNNSSRFGKFVEIQFDQSGKISGAAIRTYLLESSRVCQISDPERNYHCFYMLCSAPYEDIERYKLGNPREFHYLNQSNCFEVDALDDAKDYLETRRAMDIVGISSYEQDAIFRVVAAILHLGNVEFSEGDEPDSSVPKDEKSWSHLQTAAELFMCDAKALEESLCKRALITRDGKIIKNLNPSNAALSRDSLAKVVYSQLFDWLVDRINSSIGQDPDSKFKIGVLDIYGFESFKTNSFEQFCINLTNEKLQQHFNQHVFKMEQEEYIKEEIDWTTIEFVDNQDILDLVEKKPGGIIALLDEACMLPRSTHETFAQKLYQAFAGHPRFTKPKLSRTDFIIHHYAGDVLYQTELFLDKNKYYVVAEHREVLNASKCSFISSLFPALSEDSSKSSKFSSVALRFKQQLQSLMETLNATQPHYIRCVKPNSLLRPLIFENTNVLQQLRCGGVLEAIRISCAGYPTRRLFDEFIYRFGLLAPQILDESYDEATMAKKLLDAVGIAGYQIGKTKVFLRAGQMAELDARRNELQTLAARKIQRKARTILARKNFILLQKSAIQLQAVCRGQIARELFENLRRQAASLIIQTYYRMHLAKRAYTCLFLASTNIQAGMRGMAARKEYHLRRVTKAAIIIQSYWRRYLALGQYSRLKKAAITMQSAWRGRVARKELRKLKMAARETGALQAAKNKLEKQLEEVTLRLQLERRMRVEMEEAKSQEIAKLQIALQNTQLELKNTKDQLVKEKESRKEATGRSADVEAIPVFNTEQMDKITSENEQLKALVSSLETKISETEKKYEETSRVSEERLRKALEAESKLSEFNGLMLSFQEKLSNMESENQILRKQTLLHSPVKVTTEPLLISSNPLKHKVDNNNNNNNNQHIQETKENQAVPPTPKVFAKSDSTLRRSYVERQHNAVDALINYATGTIGFSQGKPIPALITYKCLLHWKSFEAERTNVFDRLIQMIGSSIQNEESIDHLSYWLSSASTLLALLQITLKPANANVASQKPPIPTTFFGRMAQGFRASSANISVDNVNFIRHVEAKYPALLFKQQLTAYVEIIYGIIRDNVKKDLTPLLSLCAQAPRTTRTNSMKRSSSKNADKTNHWRSLVEKLDDLLKVFQENYVPTLVIRRFFTQIFSFINVQLFNSLLLRRECCSFSNGEYMKSGLTELEAWCKKTKSEYLDSSWDELKHTRQAVGFLVIFQKYRISYDDIVTELCPMLSARQMYKICTQYWDDKYNSQSVSASVLSSMNMHMTYDVDASGSKFLLDDDGSIPFTLDDVASSIDEKDFSDVKLPEEILENPSFQFLHD